MVKGWGDPELVRAASDALAKIEAVLPDQLKYLVQDLPIYAVNLHRREEVTVPLGQLRSAIRNKQMVRFKYTRKDGVGSERTVRPLALSFFAPVWLLTGWCELRDDFRNFRLDRMGDLELLEEEYREEPGKMMQDYLRTVVGE